VLKARKAISHGAEVSLTVGREGRSGYLEVNGDYVTRNSRVSLAIICNLILCNIVICLCVLVMFTFTCNTSLNIL